MSKNINLSGLAKLAGVSTSTVSRALNNNALIKQETRERIHALAKQYNFSLNTAASRLRTQKTKVIAVILNLVEHTDQSVSDPFLLKLVADLNLALNDRGYELLLSNSFMATDNWSGYFVDGKRADGLIVIGQAKNDGKVIDVSKSGVPLVVWGDPLTQAEYTIVGSNNWQGGQLATQHLLRGGAKQLIFLGDPEHAEMQERYKGFCSALDQAHIAHDHSNIESIDITSRAAYERITQILLQRGVCFDGIVCASDMVAIGAMKALKEQSINIPEEVSIVGFDDILMAELMHPSLTTVRQKTRPAANVIVDKIIQQIESKKTQSQVMDLELIVRNSTRRIIRNTSA